MLKRSRQARPARASRSRGRRVRLGLLVAALVVFVVVAYRPLFLGNFATVDPGRVYRSAQPGREFDQTIRRHRLGSVVNLRGGSLSDAFYRDEAGVAERLGIEFYDLPLGATRRPSRRELMLAIAVLNRCRYPILIHCKWGSDRTAMMSALYRMIRLGEPPERAVGEFSLAHGHVPLFGPEKLHEPFAEYAAWLRQEGLTHDPARFRHWIEREYRADDPFTSWPSIRPGPRPSVAAAASTLRR